MLTGVRAHQCKREWSGEVGHRLLLLLSFERSQRCVCHAVGWVQCEQQLRSLAGREQEAGREHPRAQSLPR